MHLLRLVRVLPLLSWWLALCLTGWAQAPPSIQFFLPGGVLPERELRFTLKRSDGREEILFTDNKGKYELNDAWQRQGDFTIYIETDRRTYATTVQSFRLIRTVEHVPVFLAALKAPPPPKSVVDVADLDGKAPPAARAAHEQGMKAFNAGNAEAAIGAFTQALALYPQYLRALNDLGVLYLKLNRLDEAAATFQQAISLNARFYFPRLNLGVVRNRQRRYTQAVEILAPLVKEMPALTQARLTLADGLIASQQWDEAEEQLRTALKDEKLDRHAQAEAHQKLAVVFNHAQSYEAAAREFEKEVALEPDVAAGHLYLGAAYVQLKKVAEAERELLKAYELAGKAAASAQLLLGQLYYGQQKFELAQRAFEQYLSDMPNAQNAAQVKQAVEQIKALLKAK
mgnify:CR=1 FL=1